MKNMKKKFDYKRMNFARMKTYTNNVTLYVIREIEYNNNKLIRLSIHIYIRFYTINTCLLSEEFLWCKVRSCALKISLKIIVLCSLYMKLDITLQ